MYQVGDLIDFEGKKFIILTNFNDEGVDYAFINETDENADEVMDSYYIVKYLEDGSIEKIVDQSIIDKVYPQLQEGLKQTFEENGVDFNAALEELNKGEE